MPDSQGFPTADAAYAEFLRLEEQGQEADFEEFCRRCPSLADGLRILHFLRAGSSAGAKTTQREATLPVPEDNDPGSRERKPPGPAGVQSHPERIGPYRILEVLGEGGMGVVYLAEQREPIHRRVALKVIKLGMDTWEVVARFESERQALALMSHPNIAKILDALSTEEGRPFFVMEHVPGEPITHYCDRNHMSIRERLELFIPVCEAVQHAHQKAIIHRDLKPSNVLVMVQDEKPVPKVIDFGVAKATDHRLTEKTVFTEQGQIIGTPEYMSPEQAEMGTLDIDTRTDIYSLGIILYELLVGALPFDARVLRQRGYAELQRMIREEEPPRPSTRLSGMGKETTILAQKRRTEPGPLVRQVRGDLDWITMKAMEKDRTRRYSTASEFAADLRRHLDHEPVLAGPPRTAYRLRKLLRKHRGLVAAAGAVVLTLIVGLCSTSVALYLKAEKELELRTALGENQKLLSQVLQVQRLSDAKLLSELTAAAGRLWPCVPEKVPALERWAAEARALAGRLDVHRSTLETHRRAALPYDQESRLKDHARHPLAARMEAFMNDRKLLTDEAAKEKATVGAEDQATLLSFGGDPRRKPITCYFRTTFNAPPRLGDSKLKFRMAIDDGAIVYLNGGEVLRSNMPEGPIDAGTLTPLAVETPHDFESEVTWSLEAGKNTLAAEVHQSSPQSSDLRFSLELLAGTKVLVQSHSLWSYWDSGQDPGRGWNSAGFDDSSWPSGPAALGYGFDRGRGRLLEIESRFKQRGAEMAALKESIGRSRFTWKFAELEAQFQHDVLAELVAGLQELIEPDQGLVADVSRRLDFARRVQKDSIDDHRDGWTGAMASIADPGECPRYGRLKIIPQLGLVPIGRDRQSGLWEFAHLQTGEAPGRDKDGRLILSEQSALVFILIPGGTFRMGAVVPGERNPPGSPNADPHALTNESPIIEVVLRPFFISKYEMTQGQWLRATGKTPSRFNPTLPARGKQHSLLHPVEQVSWESCNQVLEHLGLVLPTEAQWEYAARAGTVTVWWTGNFKESVAGAANLTEDWLVDGSIAHAPVGSYRANPFGLHDVIGNVWEWCRDWYDVFTTAVRSGDGQTEHASNKGDARVNRGGGYDGPAALARSAARYASDPQYRFFNLGIRPARVLVE